MSSGPMTWIRALFLNSVFVPRLRALRIQVAFVSELFEHEKVDALVDSGATHNFMSRPLAESLRLQLHPMETTRTIWNIDGSVNAEGMLTHYTDLCLRIGNQGARGDHLDEGARKQCFFIVHLGEDSLILGYPWLAAENLPINWNHPDPTLQVYATKYNSFSAAAFALHKGDQLYMQIRKATHVQILAEQAADKTRKEWTDLVPPELHSFSRVFSEEVAHQFPEPKRWDHAIELLPETPDTMDCKVYPLTMAEQEALDQFIKEHLDKGYIQTSSSLYAAPFFFVKKKDGRLRPVQDYRHLNQWTKKNKYPLPLIAELVEKVPGNDWYSAMDVCWGYNNV